MAQRRMSVRPEVLAWARRSAGLSVEEAAQRIGVKTQRVHEWEAADQDPTMKQVRDAAAAYNRPLAALFLTSPPANEQLFDVPDFRRPSAAGEESATLRRAILRARRQQEALEEVLEDDVELEAPLVDVIEFDEGEPVSSAAKKLRVGLRMDELPRRALQSPEEMLRLVVRAAEARGYLVIQVQRVAIGEMRGFSLTADPVPVVAINSADWPRGKVFTLLHELVHIGQRQGALCDLSRETSDRRERYCDAVAAAALMPQQAFRLAAAGVDAGSYSQLRALGDGFGVSAEAALLRMVKLNLALWDDYHSMKPSFQEAYQKHKQDERDRAAGKDTPLYYQLKARDLGRPFIRTVIRAHQDGALSARDTSSLLEVSYDKIPKLATTAAAPAGV